MGQGKTPFCPMTITEKQQEEMLEAAKPLIRWLNENCHPHCTARVDQFGLDLG